MRRAGFVALALLGAPLWACHFSGAAGRGAPPANWAEAVATRGVDPRLVPDPTASTPEMDEVAVRLAGPGTTAEKLSRLQQALVNRREFRFERETWGTFTAIEAFRERRGNCVSFTNLFIAMGRSLGIRLEASLVKRRPEWEERGEFIVIYSHMVAIWRRGKVFQVYDFWGQAADPAAELMGLSDLDVAGIGFGNHGVWKLEAGNVAGAAADFATAVRLAPRLPGLWANLGLARWRSGDVAGALAAYRSGLQIDPGSASILQNLAVLYRTSGKLAEARAALAAANTGETTPYTLLARGDLELAMGNAGEGLTVFKRVRRMAPRLVAAWVGVARAERALGHLARARNAARRAQRLAPADPDVARLLRELEGQDLEAPDRPPSESPSPRAEPPNGSRKGARSEATFAHEVRGRPRSSPITRSIFRTHPRLVSLLVD